MILGLGKELICIFSIILMIFGRFFGTFQISVYTCCKFCLNRQTKEFFMKKLLPVFVLLLPLVFGLTAFGQNSESIKTIMANSWVKKLKNDLEEKATYAKGLKKVKESDLKNLESAYNQTSEKLESWLDDMVTTLGTNQKEAIDLLADGKINQELKDKLLAVFSFYSSEFLTCYEEITGDEGQNLFNHARLMEDGQPCGTHPDVEKEKIDKDFLLSSFKKPLVPSGWDALN
jgi:Skp family chaperone for outer membrane proteins